MNEVKVADTILKAAEKAAAIDLEEVERTVKDHLRNLNGADAAGKLVNAVNPNNRERTEKRVQATLDIAYLLGNLGNWYSENQEKCFEKIAACLGRKPGDVSPDAVGLNAKLAHLSSRVSEEELLAQFIDSVRSSCESFGGMVVPSRRAFALWITLGLADGEMPALYRKALQLLRGEFKHSALLFGALGGLPVFPLAAGVGGTGMGIFCAIMGGLQGLRYKQQMDKYAPLISEKFLEEAEALIRKMNGLESQLAETDSPALRQEYGEVSRQLQELIEPPSPDDDEEEEEDDEEE